MRFGIFYGAAARYPDVVLKYHPRGWVFKAFWNTEGFGKCRDLYKKMAASGKAPILSTQAIWDDNHRFDAEDDKQSLKIIKVFNDIAKQYPHLEFHYSPFCEHTKDRATMLKHFAKCLSIGLSPNVKLVNAPIRGGQFVNDTRFLDEAHHNNKPSGAYDIFDFDGLHAFDANVEKWLRDNAGVYVFYFWVKVLNMIRTWVNPRTKKKERQPRKDRRAKPDGKVIKSITLLASPKAPGTYMDKGFTYKSHAEQHDDVDYRANKPVVLGPIGKRFKKCEFRKGGKVIATLRESGTTDNRHVFRCAKWGMDLGQFEVWMDGKKRGFVDGNFREGDFRDTGE